jgi:hypothetical protein
MSRYWSSLVHRLTPYVPGEQPKLARLVKLNTNENPYPPSPRVLEAITEELRDGGERLRLYPDPSADRLKEAVAARFADFGIRRSRSSSATARMKCWRMYSWRCSSTSADSLPRHHLQLLSGLLRLARGRLCDGAAG